MTEQLPATRQQIAARLASRKVRDVDAALELQASQLNVQLNVGVSVVKADGQTFFPPRSVQINGSHDGLKRLADTYRKAMTSPDEAQVEEWLAELSVIVARRPDDDFTESLRLAAYSKRLCEYPADVARHASIEHTWKFWPSWDEMKAVCDAMSLRRRMVLRKLEDAAAQKPEAPTEVSPEDMAARREAANAILRDIGFKFGADQGETA